MTTGQSIRGRNNQLTSRNVDEAARRLLELSREPAIGPVLTRALNALVRLAEGLDARAAGEASGESTDLGALVRLVEQSAASGRLDRSDPLADARLRWIRDRERLLSVEGPPLKARDVAELLGVTRQAVAKSRAAGRLVGLPIRPRVYVYPAWQFEQARVFPGLSAVGEALGGDDP